MKKCLTIIAIIVLLICAFGTEALADFKLDENGVLWGKGDNSYGQLGFDPQLEKGKLEYTKEFVPILDNVKSYCGSLRIYAIREDNSLWAWGKNDNGQCGVGNTEDVYKPTKIMDNVKMIKPTTCGALAIDENDVLYAWGRSEAWMGMAYSKGVLGVGDNKEPTLTPVKVLDDVRSVYADFQTLATMAVKNNGELWAAGSETANPNCLENACVFTKVEGIENVKEVSLTTFNVRVDTYDGDVYFCGEITDWGGTGSFPLRVVKEFKTPVKVMSGVDKAIGNRDIFGFKSDGTLWYWGEDKNYIDAECIMNNVKDIREPGFFLKSEGTLYKYDYYYSENEPLIEEVLTNVDCFLDDETVQRKDGTKWTIKNKVERIKEAGEISIVVNLKDLKTDVATYIKNDRTMVPMRAIFEALGAEVIWDDATKTAIAVKGDAQVKITIGENVLYKNGEAITLDAVAEITNDRTMVPVRAISEAFGAEVKWDNDKKAVEIISSEVVENRIFYTYDDKGNMIRKTQGDSVYDYKYDDNGTLLSYTVGGAGFWYEYLYDDQGRVIRKLERSNMKNHNFIYEYTYNIAGQIATVGMYHGNVSYDMNNHTLEDDFEFEIIASYVYDYEGKCIYAYTDNDARKMIDYIYDEEGKLTSTKGYDGTVTKYYYDQKGQLMYEEAYKEE